MTENPEPSAGETPAEHWSLLFGVRRSIRYHLRRERFLDGAHNLGALVAAISGSAAVASLLGRLDPALVTAAVTVTAVAGAAELVFRTAKTARLHNELAREFIALEKELVLAGEGLPRTAPARASGEASRHRGAGTAAPSGARHLVPQRTAAGDGLSPRAAGTGRLLATRVRAALRLARAPPDRVATSEPRGPFRAQVDLPRSR